MKKAIVFGGSGFIGSHVADILTDQGYVVTVFDIKESPYLTSGQIFIKGDILDKKRVEEAAEGNEVVFNFAGEADIDIAKTEPLKTITSNVVGNTNILEACRKHKVKRFVYASTIYVYSDAGSFYRSSNTRRIIFTCKMFN